MAFVNEYIPEVDIEKYGIKTIDQSLFGKEGTTNRRDWTIDRERNIYLRKVANSPRESADNIYRWTFFGEEHSCGFSEKSLA